MLDANTKHGKKKQKKVYGPYKETKTDGLYAYFKKKWNNKKMWEYIFYIFDNEINKSI